MGKILQILIIENRDLAHAQTFCTRVLFGPPVVRNIGFGGFQDSV